MPRHGPLYIALFVIALVIIFGRERKPTPNVPPPAVHDVTPPRPEPIPPEPPFGALRRANSELPCDVDEVLANKCRRCHGTPTRHGAPFTLYTWADLQVPRSAEPLYVHVGRVVRSGFMPYRIQANPPVEALTEVEKKTLLAWVDAGAPRAHCELEPD